MTFQPADQIIQFGQDDRVFRGVGAPVDGVALFEEAVTCPFGQRRRNGAVVLAVRKEYRRMAIGVVRLLLCACCQRQVPGQAKNAAQRVRKAYACHE